MHRFPTSREQAQLIAQATTPETEIAPQIPPRSETFIAKGLTSPTTDTASPLSIQPIPVDDSPLLLSEQTNVSFPTVDDKPCECEDSVPSLPPKQGRGELLRRKSYENVPICVGVEHASVHIDAAHPGECIWSHIVQDPSIQEEVVWLHGSDQHNISVSPAGRTSETKDGSTGENSVDKLSVSPPIPKPRKLLNKNTKAEESRDDLRSSEHHQRTISTSPGVNSDKHDTPAPTTVESNHQPASSLGLQMPKIPVRDTKSSSAMKIVSPVVAQTYAILPQLPEDKPTTAYFSVDFEKTANRSPSPAEPLAPPPLLPRPDSTFATKARAPVLAIPRVPKREVPPVVKNEEQETTPKEIDTWAEPVAKLTYNEIEPASSGTQWYVERNIIPPPLPPRTFDSLEELKKLEGELNSEAVGEEEEEELCSSLEDFLQDSGYHPGSEEPPLPPTRRGSVPNTNDFVFVENEIYESILSSGQEQVNKTANQCKANVSEKSKYL